MDDLGINVLPWLEDNQLLNKLSYSISAHYHYCYFIRSMPKYIM